jgi:hypothetical protein
MVRYLPGAILAVFGVVTYVIGCVLFTAHRRQRDAARKSMPVANDNPEPGTGSNTLFVYAVAMMILGIVALGAGLYALEVTQMHAAGG